MVFQIDFVWQRIVACLESMFEQINAHSQIGGYLIYLYHPKLDAMLVLLLTLVSITKGNWSIQLKYRCQDKTLKR